MDINDILSNGAIDAFGNCIGSGTERVLNIHLQQYGRKSVTTVFGIEQIDYDLRKLSSKLSSTFSCSCSIKTVKEGDDVGKKFFKMSGDHRKDVKNFLTTRQLVSTDDKIIIHGA